MLIFVYFYNVYSICCIGFYFKYIMYGLLLAIWVLKQFHITIMIVLYHIVTRYMGIETFFQKAFSAFFTAIVTRYMGIETLLATIKV